ncbi:ethylene-insensitive protein 2-like isoform X2 [Andrographis paniculata]|uniref:ethylene-insensitive protein 2-like isoform X2 n=1 Tax=Andrographis paniculata TaxID=175694 RepID=UPI0021E983EA|nr:ethylene-insensitive protein 2-like isoform X2 [Andrographis paniculata]
MNKIESEILITSRHPSTMERVLSAVGPVLWIAMSYVDPGKWAAAVEGGARFGFDLALLVLFVNFSAMLCQYLSALIPVATGRNLSQICRQEYDDATCLLLGIHAEISMIIVDLTMVLGTAYGLHAAFGIDLFNCVFLTGFEAVLFPFFNILLENTKAKTVSVCLACFIFGTYVSGALITQPESSLSVSRMLNKLTGENVYALMSIVGANITPHNFYLHSSIVQQDQGQARTAKGVVCRDLFFATCCIFSGIFLVNCMLMNSAANVFYSSGLTSLTVQDALSLFDQLVAVTWSLEREEIIQDFFGLEIPGWLHRATIRIIAIIPALFCVWNSGGEGIFQFLIFTQVLVALLLPSSIIPLFQVASSRPIMGAYKISHPVQFLAIVIFVGMLGLNIFFVIELVFGSSDWVTSLKWNIGSDVPVLYLILLMAAFTSQRLMLWLATTPLKSARWRLDSRAFKRGNRYAGIDSISVTEDPTGTTQNQYKLVAGSSSSKKSEILSCSSLAAAIPEFLPESRKVDEKADFSKLEVMIKDISDSGRSLRSEDPKSLKCSSRKGDDVGSGAGSVSRFSGLSCAARHQLTAVLDEFWGHLFDFHGQPTHEAKVKKLDALLGIDVKSIRKESSRYIPSAIYNGSLQQIGQHHSATPCSLGPSMKPNYVHFLDLYVENLSCSAIDSASERRYHSMCLSSSSYYRDQQPATIPGCDIASYLIRVARKKASGYPKSQIDLNSTDAYNQSSGKKPRNRLCSPPVFHNILKSDRYFRDPGFPKSTYYRNIEINVKKFRSLPNVSGLLTSFGSSWDRSYGLPAVKKMCSGYSPSKVRRNSYSAKFSSHSSATSLWPTQPHEQFGVAGELPKYQEFALSMNTEANLLKLFRKCTMKLVKIEGSDWLFRSKDGADEDLISRVAARERFFHKIETLTSQHKFGSAMQIDDREHPKFVSVPNCGDGCVWRVDIITSFGVWCILRILELALVESRPELWGRYSYLLNRLQGIIDLAFSKPRATLPPCFCLQLPSGYEQNSSLENVNSSFSAATVVAMIEDVEIALSRRKDRSNAEDGDDVAFLKGKEKLAFVLKQYKCRLSSNPAGVSPEDADGLCRGSTEPPPPPSSTR